MSESTPWSYAEEELSRLRSRVASLEAEAAALRSALRTLLDTELRYDPEAQTPEAVRAYDAAVDVAERALSGAAGRAALEALGQTALMLDLLDEKHVAERIGADDGWEIGERVERLRAALARLENSDAAR